MNASIIPPGWEQHHRPIVETSYTALVELTETTTGYDLNTGPVEETTVLARFPARVQQKNREGATGTPGDTVDTREYQITCSIHECPKISITPYGPQLIVTGYKPGHDGDPHLIGVPLTVTNVQYGSLMFERVITARMNL